LSTIFDFLGVTSLSENEVLERDGKKYRFIDGILRQQLKRSKTARQTEETYSHLWENDDSYASDQHIEYVKKSMEYEYPSILKMVDEYFQKSPVILDLGCGAGYSAYAIFNDRLAQAKYIGIDLSNSVDVARTYLASKGIEGDFLQGDISDLPFDDRIADIIFCTGVIQHTDNIEKTISSLARVIKPGGIAFFNCYRKAGPIREFSDQFIHEEIKDDTLNDAMDKLVPLTELGVSLGNLTEKITVPNDIPFLEIKKGEYPVQQFFYDYIFKSYFHENETFERMHFLNFDWYRPKNQIHVHPHEFVELAANAGLKILDHKSTGTFVSLVAKR
jgi:arsenite methyltransferase